MASRLEPATAAIVEVLDASDMPLAIADVQERVERSLGRSINRASIKAALSEMAASEHTRVRRVGRGRYESTPRDATLPLEAPPQ